MLAAALSTLPPELVIDRWLPAGAGHRHGQAAPVEPPHLGIARPGGHRQARGLLLLLQGEELAPVVRQQRSGLGLLGAGDRGRPRLVLV